MVFRFLKLTFRNLRKNLLYSIIVISGLSLGLVTFLAIIQFTGWHLEFDKHFPSHENIYRLSLAEQRENFERHTARIIHGDFVNQLYHADLQGVDKITRIAPFRNAIVRKNNLVFFEDKAYAADPEFLDIFQPEITLGNREKLLNAPGNVIISESTAKKYFGYENPVGEDLEIVHQFDEEAGFYEITGVYKDFPKNSHFDIQLLTSHDNPDTYSGTAWVYLKCLPEADLNSLHDQVKKIIIDNNEESYSNGVDPFLICIDKIHLNSHLARELSKNIQPHTLIILFIAGMLVLTLAWFNFTLLAISQNQMNVKKLVYQWQMGATKKIFYNQFLVDFLTIGLISLLLALILAILLRPLINQAFDVALFQNKKLLLTAILIILGIIIISALLTSLFATTRLFRLLKEKYFSSNSTYSKTGHYTNWFIKGVIIAEFIITYVLVSNLLMINEQLKFSIGQQIGSNDSTTIQMPDLPRPVIDKYDLFRDELIKYNQIDAISAMMEEPGGMAMDAFGYTIEGIPKTEDRLFVFPVDENFSRFYNLNLLAGKDLPVDFDKNDTVEYFLLNETAAKLHTDDYNDLIGRNLTLDFKVDGILYPGEIIGVVEDFHLSDMGMEINPMLIFPEYVWLYCFSIRLNGNSQDGLETVKKVWKELFPEYPFRYYYTTELYRNLYQTELTEIRALIIFSILSLIIAGTGLFALSGFFMNLKMHAAAIRKINGADIRHILVPELRHYFFLALISSIVAAPLSWFTITQWQKNFIYQADTPGWLFPSIAILLMLFSWLSVIYHSLKLANINPIHFIKQE